MTRFVGEAVGHRKGTGNSNTGKSRQKKLEKFLETGTHDDIERAKLLNENSRIPLLPDFDPNRSFVFMDISIASKHVGEPCSLGSTGLRWESTCDAWCMHTCMRPCSCCMHRCTKLAAFATASPAPAFPSSA